MVRSLNLCAWPATRSDSQLSVNELTVAYKALSVTKMVEYFDWRISLVSCALSPLVILGGIFMSKFNFKKDDGFDDEYRDSNALLSDIIINYKTVISFGEKNVEKILEKYS